MSAWRRKRRVLTRAAWLVNRLGSLPTFLFLGLGTEVLAVGGLYWLFHRRGWIGGG